MEAPVLEFERVTVGFDRGPKFKDEVLHDIGFRLEAGQTKVLLGAAGSGKSVLLKTALGLIRPDSGRVLLFGRDLAALTEEEMFPLRQRAGMVFQEGALFDSLTVAENVAYGLHREGVVSEEDEQRVREALRFVELEDMVDKLPAELSGGMRRRVAIARAFVGNPPLILYDSPTAGLDPVTAYTITALIIKLRDTQQVSSLLVTHRLQDGHLLANSYFDPATGSLARVPGNGRGAETKVDTRTSFLVLREGDLVFQGSERELFAARDPYVRKFIS